MSDALLERAPVAIGAIDKRHTPGGHPHNQQDHAGGGTVGPVKKALVKASDVFAPSYDDETPSPQVVSALRDVYGGPLPGGITASNVQVKTWTPRTVDVIGDFLDADGKKVGRFERRLAREGGSPDGSVTAVHEHLEFDQNLQGQGIAAAFNQRLIDWYRDFGVEKIQLYANIDVGGYAWAREGYDWLEEDSAANALQWLEDMAQKGSPRIPADRLAAQQDLAKAMLKRFETAQFGSADYPTPFEVSQLGRWPGAGKDDWWIGKAVMMTSRWDGVKPL